MPEVAKAIVDYEKFLESKDLLLKKKISNWRERIVEMLREELLQRVLRESLPESELVRLAADVAEHRQDPYSLVEEVVNNFSSAKVPSPRRRGDAEKSKTG